MINSEDSDIEDAQRVEVIIPFRDRGTDPRRAANLEIVEAWWTTHGYTPQVVDDGLESGAPFNRHKAYNLAVSKNPDAKVFVLTEADMLIPIPQLQEAVDIAYSSLGLVVPFTQYRYLSDDTTMQVREDLSGLDVFSLEPESTMDGGTSIGAINVVSRETLDLTGGFTEATSGNWYDDNITEEGFAFLAGPTRWVTGPAVHLYHLPGHAGDHLTEEDKQATQHNKEVLENMRQDIRENRLNEVRDLMGRRS